MSSVKDKIPEGWVETTLVELTKKIGSGATPRGGSDSYKEQGISLIRSQNILDFDFSYNGLAFIDETQARKLSNVTLEQKDVLINITGDSVARVCMVPSRVLPARVNQHVAIIRANTQKIDNHFLLYYLLDPNFKRFLLQIASNGATRNALTKSDLESLLIKTPIDLKEQKSIAQVLTAFDDKIENLRAQNQTLETLAQTIFKEWFGIYQVGDELPEGWRVGKLSEIANLKSGYAFKSKDFIDESKFKAIKIKDLKGNGNINLNDISSITREITELERVQYFKLKEGDILLAMSGNTTGKIGVMPSSENDIYLNQRVGKFFMKQNKFNTYLYNFLMSGSFEEKILAMGYGSAQPNISPSQIENIDVIYPDDLKMIEFLNISNPIFKKVLKNNQQIQTLTQTRDTLLPKLMSGALRVEGFGK